MSELPKGWIETRISDLCDLRYGKNLPTKDLTTTGYPVFGANGQIGLYTDYHYEEPQVLITCRGATCGTINRSLPKSFVTNNSIVIRPFDNESVDDRFLELFLKSTRTDGIITGSAQPQITLDNLQHLQVRLAPLNEQKRIVAKLDELLPKVEACKERLQKIPTILKRFRQSVLAAAVSGKLTEEWRKGKSIEEAGWQTKQLDELCKVQTGATPLRKNQDYWKNGTIPWIKTGEVQNCDITSAEEMITEQAIDETNAKVFPSGTILIAMYGEGKTRGQVGIMRIGLPPFSLSQ